MAHGLGETGNREGMVAGTACSCDIVRLVENSSSQENRLSGLGGGLTLHLGETSITYSREELLERKVYFKL